MRIVRTLVADNQKRVLLVIAAKRPGIWELPGGKAERKDKNDFDTARRELQQETGVVMTKGLYLYQRIDIDIFDGAVSVAFAYTGFVATQYRVNTPPSIPNDEIAALGWFSLEELATMKLERNSRRFIIRWCRRRPPYCRPALL